MATINNHFPDFCPNNCYYVDIQCDLKYIADRASELHFKCKNTGICCQAYNLGKEIRDAEATD